MAREASRSSDFDAYHKWLGIPPAEQPPHYYRLLGLAEFESDADVIATAADRQMAHIKSFASGQHAQASQKLLNELARVRLTLLNDRMKETYDRGLRESIRASSGTPSLEGSGLGRDSRSLSEQQAADIFPESIDPPLAAPCKGGGSGVGEDDLADIDEWAPPRRTDVVGARGSRSRQQLDLGSVLLAGASLLVLAACFWYATAAPPRGAQLPTGTPAVVERAEVSPPSDARPPQRSKPARPASVSRDPEPAKKKFDFGPRVDATSEEATDEKPTAEEAPDDASSDAQEATRVAAPSSTPATPEVVETIDLDLDVRRQKHRLGNSVPLRYRVIALRGCDASHTIEPKGGVLAENVDVTIVVAGVREVRILLELRFVDASEASILLSAVVVNDEGNEVPFNLKRMEAIQRDILKQGDEATVALENLRGESDQLKGWMDSGGAKPLADVKAARARVAAIKELIPEQEAFVKALAADLKVADSLRMLAGQLHERGTIEVAAGD